MILLLCFLTGMTLAFFLAPDWPLAANLLVPLVVVLVGRFALFWVHAEEK